MRGSEYKVFVVAIDEKGNEVEMRVTVYYIDKKHVREQEREEKAVEELKARRPDLRNIRVKYSIHA